MAAVTANGTKAAPGGWRRNYTGYLEQVKSF